MLRDLLNAGLAWLDRHHEIVNALNVFPVPDGDTGTNMLLTMKSACGEITDDHLHSAGAVAKAAAHGALMGARGNSGVILSQILRGMSRAAWTISRRSPARCSRRPWLKAVASPTKASTGPSKAPS